MKRERLDSNALIASVRLEPTYKIDKFTVGPIGGVQYRDRNEYDPVLIEFVPAKTRFTAGGQATYAVTEKAMLNARLEHIWTHVDQTPAFPLPSIARDGFLGVVGGTVTF